MIQPSASPHLMWVYSGELAHVLDAATWLDTTRELRKLGWRVTLVTGGPADQHCVRGVEVLCLPRPDIYLLRHLVFQGRLWRLILQQGVMVDVVLFHQMSAPWLLPLRFLRHLKGRTRPLLVMDFRSLYMPSRQGLKDRVRRIFLGLMSQMAIHWVDGYLVITQRMAESLRLPSQRLWGAWPSGVNLEQFSSAQAARRWPLQGEPIHLIYIGALHYERNLLTLSEAVKRANVEGMAFQLTLMGEGTARAELEQFAVQSAGQIRVMPPVPHDEVPQVLAQAHVGVLPFPDEEKFRVSSPIKLFEYMAAGLPVLATRILCHTDVIGSGEFVFWAEQADAGRVLAALRRISQNREGLNRMGTQAALAAQAWTWQESARKLKTALERGIGTDNRYVGGRLEHGSSL